MTKNAYMPKGFAEKLAPAYWEGDKKGDMGKPVATFKKKAAEAFLEKAKQLAEIRITERDKNNGEGVTVANFLKNAAALSEAQGHLSMTDLRELAGLTALTFGTGHVAFRNVLHKLMLAGCIANVRGRTAADDSDETGIDWNEFSIGDDEDSGELEIKD